MARYFVTKHQEYGANVYRLRDDERRAEAVLYPAFGNNCTEFRTTPDPDGKDTRGQDCEPVDLFVPPENVESLQESPFHSGQPLLFPFPNRVRNGEYSFEGKDYSMAELLAKGWDTSGGQAIHGLVADKAWTVDEAIADEHGALVSCHLQLDRFADIFRQYSFPCRLVVTYRLYEGALEMHTAVHNVGLKTLPMGFGIHPWFPTTLRPGVRLPAGMSDITREQRDRARVHVPADALWELQNLMPTGNILPLDTQPEFDLRDWTPIDGKKLDTVFTRVRRRPDGWSEGGLRDPVTGLEMYLTADKAFREWVLFAPENRYVIALEPYTCVTDAVNLEPRGLDAGLIALPAGQTWTGTVRFGLRRSA